MKAHKKIISLVCSALMLTGCGQIAFGNEEMPEIPSTDEALTDIVPDERETETQTSVTEASVITLFSENETADTVPPIIQALPPSQEHEEQTHQSVTVITLPTAERETVTKRTEAVTESERITEETTVSVQTTAEVTEETAVQTTVTEVTSSESAQIGYYPATSYYPLNFSRQKAVWISYLEYDRIMKNADEQEFTESLAECFDNIVMLGCNTVYFQVRAYGDAYYDSALFPKADRLTGAYDPLKIAVKLAHDRGLSLHAWINPMRLMTDAGIENVPLNYPIGEWYHDSSKNGTYMVKCDGRWYLNPAYSETVKLICEGIAEILSSYDVDGVQADDYFYPTTDKSFDSAAYAASGTTLSLDDWRRENVTRMVKLMYRTVHSVNPNAVFGISPQGNINNNLNTLYADVYTWTSEAGCCDYICPQIYFGFENGALPFTETVDTWSKLIKRTDIDLVIGLAAYKSGNEDQYAGSGRGEWQNNTDILSRQIAVTDIYNAGYSFFRYDSLFYPEPAAESYVNAEIDNILKK